MSDPETIRVYDAKAEEYAELVREIGEEDQTLAAFIADCPPGGRVLDLGCGPGGSAAVMAGAGLQVDATDASAEMVAMAARIDGVTAWQASFEEIDTVDHYDGIWANFSLLHADRAALPELLKSLRRALRDGGRFHIAVKEGDGAARDAIGRLYTYYRQDELEGLLSAAGFTVVGSASGTTRGMDGVMANWFALAADA